MPWEKQFDVDEVLSRAMMAFWTNGYSATSMQDLVECTGVNRASLYATYGDKHALFLSALRLYDENNRHRLLAELESKHRPLEAIRQLYLAFTAQVSEKGGNRGCLLTNTALELAAHDKNAAAIVANSQAQIEAFLARMIRKGKASGEIAAHVKTAECARGLLASLVGVIVMTRSRPEKALLQSIVDDAMRRLE